MPLSADCVGSADRVRACFLIIRNNAAGIALADNRISWVDYAEFAYWYGVVESQKYWRFINLSGMDSYTTDGYYGSAGPGNAAIDDFTDGRATRNMIAGHKEIDTYSSNEIFGQYFVRPDGLELVVPAVG